MKVLVDFQGIEAIISSSTTQKKLKKGFLITA